MAEEEYDVVVIGTGSAGKPLAGELARAGWSVLAIEQALVGGECAHLACIPSKAMLLAAKQYRSARARSEQDRLDPSGGSDGESQAGSEQDRSDQPGGSDGGSQPGRDYPDRTAYAAAVAIRDRTTRYRDDAAELAGMEEDGVTVVRGSAVVEGRTVRIDPPGTGTAPETATEPPGGSSAPEGCGTSRRTARWRYALVLATGAEAILPPIDGLTPETAWTSPDALSSDELPDRLAILGGGAVGCELAQVYASFGCQVTLIEASATLLPRETGWLGEAMAQALQQVGVDVRTSTTVTVVEAVSAGTAAVSIRTTDVGAPITADRLLVAVGKRPRTSGFGLDTLGIEAGEDGALAVDARCRVITEAGPLPDVFAIGDVTALAPYTHTANYHARLVAAQLLGHGEDGDHTGIPRLVYTDPPVFCTGETEVSARERGARVQTASFDAAGTSRSAVERTADQSDHRPARLQLIADADTGVLLGAAAIGPEADSWAAELALAVRTRTTVHTLARVLHAFPSWTEAIHVPARELAGRISAETGSAAGARR